LGAVDQAGEIGGMSQVAVLRNVDYGEVRWDADVTNGRGESVAKYDVLTLVAKEWKP
jgi:hypothetical protein